MPRKAKPERELHLSRFLRRLLLWLLPVVAVWVFVTPFYNVFLVTAGENLSHLAESPNVTELSRRDVHRVVVERKDHPRAITGPLGFRVTDLHFPLVLLGALFLAVDVPWRQRLENLGWAILISIFFHIALVFLWVKFLYATQMGSLSMELYGPLAREFWGMAKHLADLPVKLALPLALWAAFYLRRLLPAAESRG